MKTSELYKVHLIFQETEICQKFCLFTSQDNSRPIILESLTTSPLLPLMSYAFLEKFLAHMSNNKNLIEMSEKLATSDAAIVQKDVPNSDNNEDDSEDETEGADEVLDSDSEDKDLQDNASTIHGGDVDEESESLDPRIQVKISCFHEVYCLC